MTDVVALYDPLATAKPRATGVMGLLHSWIAYLLSLALGYAWKEWHGYVP